MALRPGAKLGRYEVVSPLGSGGMGEVYRARDTRLAAMCGEDSRGALRGCGKQRFERENVDAWPMAVVLNWAAQANK